MNLLAKWFTRATLFACGALIVPASVAGQTLSTVGWDPSPDSQVVGYLLSWGTASGSYTSTVDVGNSTYWTLTGLVPGQRYYASVRAYDSNGVASNPSNEVTWQPVFEALLLWQDATGKVTAWHMDGSPTQSLRGWEYWSATDLPGWKAVATADFNRDGFLDIVWQNDATRQVTVWYMGRGSAGDTIRIGWSYLSSTGVPGWSVVGASDFNRDGVPDLVWQNDATHQVTVWYLGGAQGNAVAGWSYLEQNGMANWQVVGLSDFNADGHPDLVWQNQSTRQVTVWYFSGTQGNVFTGWNYLGASGAPGWTVVGARDFSADGRPDLVWQDDTTGAVTVWYLGGAQGNVFLGWSYLASGSVTGWRAFVR